MRDDVLARATRADAGHAREQRQPRRCSRRRRPRSRSPPPRRRASARASCSDRSCWYWPTPIDFGSIFTSSASGSCRRRAIETAPRSDTSRSGSSCAGDRRMPNRPTRRPPTTMIFVSFRSGSAGEQLGRELVGLARGGAVADGDQLDLVLFVQRRARMASASPTAAWARADRSSPFRRPCRWRPPPRPSRRCDSPDRGPSSRACRRARPAAGRAGCRRTPSRPRLRPPARAACEGPPQDALDARAPCPAHGVVQPFVGGAALVRDAESARDAGLVEARCRWRAPAPGPPARNSRSSTLLLLAAEHRQNAVRGQLRKRLREVEIVGELRAFLVAFLSSFALAARRPRRPASPRAAGRSGRVLAEALDQDGARAFQRCRRRRRRPSPHRRTSRRWRPGSSSDRPAARPPAAPARPRARSAPWCAASACTAGRCLRAAPWNPPP